MAAEALRIMIEHDLVNRVPDGPEMLAARDLVSHLLYSAKSTLSLVDVGSGELTATNSKVYCDLAGQISDKLSNPPSRDGWPER